MKPSKDKLNLVSENSLADNKLNICLGHSNNYVSIRVEKKHAARWLLENKSVFHNGETRYLQIKDLGLGVCEVMLRGQGQPNTVVVKAFEHY